jgi:hypothetical protein
MAVELRCPDCRAKLRLKAAPEPGTEIECPKCGTAFPAPEPEPEADEAPKKKKADGDGGQKKEKKEKPRKDAKADPKAPRKRKAKKRETSKAALVGVIAAAVMMVLAVTGVLIWFFTRTPRAVEMLCYAPEDCQRATGMNLGHAQKYPEFYKSLKNTIDGAEFKPAGDAVAKAAGTDFDGLVEHAVKAESVANGWSIIFRTKTEFDGGALAKIPGAAKQSLDGKTFYVAPDLLRGGGRARVFSPTSRLVVVCPEGMKDAVFRKVLGGHADNRDATLGVRMGELGKRVTRGTFWHLEVFDSALTAPTAPPEKSGGGLAGDEDSKTQLAKTAAETANGARGFGFKASLGSREVRFEIDVWYKDSEKSSSVAKKWKEGPLGKGDEGEPPKWFKEETQSMGDKKIAAQMLANLGFGSSGSVFYARTSVETTDLMTGAATAVGKVTGMQQRQGGMPGPPGGGMPGPPGGPRPPGMPRRRKGRR